MGVGAKCQGNAGECREMPGERMGVCKVPGECRGMQGNAGEYQGNVWECAKCHGNAGECRVMPRKHE